MVLKSSPVGTWVVRFAPGLAAEFEELSIPVQTELLAHATLLQTFGPSLGRPRVDTLNGRFYRRLIGRTDARFDAHLAAQRRHR